MAQIALLHFNGAVGSSLIEDSTTPTRPITVHGGAALSSSQVKFGSTSLRLNGNGDYLSFPHDPVLVFGGDFSIDGWVFAETTASTEERVIVGCWDNQVAPSGMLGWVMGINPANQLFFYYYMNDGTPVYTIKGGTVPLSQWNHLVVSCNDSVIRGFINGTKVFEEQHTAGYPIVAQLIPRLRIGANGAPNAFAAPMYIDELRITRDQEIYTSDFIPPTAPHTAQANDSTDPYYDNVVLLLRGEGTNGSTVIPDTSLSVRVMECVGSPTISTVAKRFGSSSMLFSDSSYLRTPHTSNLTIGTASDFTIEGSFYVTGSMIDGPAVVGQATGGNQGWFVRVTASSVIFQCSTDGTGSTIRTYSLTNGIAVAANKWYSFAVVRSGSILRTYLRDEEAGTYVVEHTGFTNFYSSTSDLTVGAIEVSGYQFFFTGYIDGVRITNGVNRYPRYFVVDPLVEERTPSPIDLPLKLITRGDSDTRHINSALVSAISADSGNTLLEGSDGKLLSLGGVYQLSDEATGTITHTFTTSIDSYTGMATVTMHGSPELSAAVGNTLQLTTDGLLHRGHRVSSIDVSGNTMTLTYVDNSGTSQTVPTTNVVNTVGLVLNPTTKEIQAVVNGVYSPAVSVSAFYADINVNSVSWNPTTHVLTILETDLTLHDIDLSVLVLSAVQASLTGDGSSSSPIRLLGDVTTPGNYRIYGTDGNGNKGWISVIPTNASGVPITQATSLPLPFVGAHGRVLDVSDPDVLIPVTVRAGTTIKRITYDTQTGDHTITTSPITSDETIQLPGYV